MKPETFFELAKVNGERPSWEWWTPNNMGARNMVSVDWNHIDLKQGETYDCRHFTQREGETLEELFLRASKERGYKTI